MNVAADVVATVPLPGTYRTRCPRCRLRHKSMPDTHLEGEGNASTQAALVLGKQQHRSVTQHVGSITLGEEIPHIHHRIDALRTFVSPRDKLAHVKIQIRLGAVERKWGDLGHCLFRLPAVACTPPSPCTVQRTRE